MCDSFEIIEHWDPDFEEKSNGYQLTVPLLLKDIKLKSTENNNQKQIPPIILLTTNKKTLDFNILGDIGVVSIIEAPFDLKTFLGEVKKCI
jgi:hypothetical protein